MPTRAGGTKAANIAAGKNVRRYCSIKTVPGFLDLFCSHIKGPKARILSMKQREKRACCGVSVPALCSQQVSTGERAIKLPANSRESICSSASACNTLRARSCCSSSLHSCSHSTAGMNKGPTAAVQWSMHGCQVGRQCATRVCWQRSTAPARPRNKANLECFHKHG